MSKFKKGNSGKPKGAISLLTRKVAETAARLGIDPFEVLLRFASGDWKALGYDKEKFIAGRNEYGIWKKWTIDPSVRIQAAKEAAQYILPKLRSIEQVKHNLLEGMSPEQRLEAMKHAVAVLEAQTKERK